MVVIKVNGDIFVNVILCVIFSEYEIKKEREILFYDEEYDKFRYVFLVCIDDEKKIN